jgi:phage terminase small subunit
MPANKKPAKKKPAKKKAAKKKAAAAPSLTEMEFTPQQVNFMKSYLQGNSATQAAIDAGYSVKGAAQQGSALLRNPKITMMIEKARARAAKKCEVHAEQVIRETANVAFSNMLDYMSIDEFGQPYLDLSRINRDTGSAIKSFDQNRIVRVTKNGDRIEECKTKIVLHDKLAALDKLDMATSAFRQNKGNVESSETRPVINVVSNIPAHPPGHNVRRPDPMLIEHDDD